MTPTKDKMAMKTGLVVNKFVLLVFGGLVLIGGISTGLAWAQDVTPLAGNLEMNQKVYSLSLDEASWLALENSLDIQIAKYDIYAARTRQLGAESIYDLVIEGEVSYRNNQLSRTSTLAGTKSLDNDYNVGLTKKLPSGTTLSLDSVHNRNWTNASTATINPSHDSSLGVTVKQELGKNFLGILDRGDVTLTRLDIQSAEFTSLYKMETMVSDVQAAYWDLVLADVRVRIEEDMLKEAEKLWENNKEKATYGLVELPDVLAAEANVRGRENQLLALRDDRQTRENVLRLLLNIPDLDAKIVPEDRLDMNGEHLDPAEHLRTAFTNRRDYQEILNQLKGQDVVLQMKRNSLWPEINLTASLARNGVDDHFSQAINKISSEDNPDMVIGLNFKIPLENSLAKSEWERSKLERAQLLLGIKLLERKISIGVMDQVRACTVAQTVADNTVNIVRLQASKLAEEQKRFARGRSNVDTLIRYQEDLLRSRLEESQAKYNAKTAWVELKRRTGVLLNEYWDLSILENNRRRDSDKGQVDK